MNQESFSSLPETMDLRQRLQEMKRRKNNAYWERNMVVAVLARLYPSGLRKTNIPNWDEQWHNCVYIDLPTGQVSWHLHDDHLVFFEHCPPYTKPYDGHTTEEKYRRLQALLPDIGWM